MASRHAESGLLMPTPAPRPDMEDFWSELGCGLFVLLAALGFGGCTLLVSIAVNWRTP